MCLPHNLCSLLSSTSWTMANKPANPVLKKAEPPSAWTVSDRMEQSPSPIDDRISQDQGANFYLVKP